MSQGIVANRTDRKRWSDRFLHQYQIILGKWAGCAPEEVIIANDDDDRKNATDLILPDGRRVAAKTRRKNVLLSYPTEIALRHNPNARYPSEWKKVLNNKAQLLLYTYCDILEQRLIKWRICDLGVLTLAHLFDFDGCIKPVEQHDDDRDVHLIAFDGLSIQKKYGKLLLASGIDTLSA